MIEGQLQQDIILVMRKLMYQILENIDITRCFVVNSLLGTCINKYLECSILITGNHMFMEDQIDIILMFVKTLRNKVHQMPINSNY